MFTDKAGYAGLEITLKNDLRNVITLRRWQKVWVVDPDSADSDFREMFIQVAAHVTDVKGMKWKRPSDEASLEELDKFYSEILPQWSKEFLELCHEKVLKLHAPMSDNLERPDDTIPKEAIAADPN